MVRILIPLMLIVYLFSCKKNSGDSSEKVVIIYEVETKVSGFSSVTVHEYYKRDNSEGVEDKLWPIDGVGTFTKIVSIKKGFNAEILAMHPTSSQWKLRIRSINGKVLAETSEIKFFRSKSKTQNQNQIRYFDVISVKVE